MIKTTIFKSNGAQAVRLPKHAAFPKIVRSVIVVRDGPRRIIVPADACWDDFFESPGIDLGARDQPMVQIRKTL